MWLFNRAILSCVVVVQNLSVLATPTDKRISLTLTLTTPCLLLR